MNKTTFRQLIAEDELRAAIEALQEFAGQKNDDALHNEIVSLAARLREYERRLADGSQSADELSQLRSQIRNGLLSYTVSLPDAPNTGAPKKSTAPGTDERVFKRRVFWFLLSAKLFIVLYILYHWSTGGLPKSEMASVIMLLVPVFTAYTTVMVNDIVKGRHETGSAEIARRVNNTFTSVTYAVFPLYVLILTAVIQQRVNGNIVDLQGLSTTLSFVESAFGVYVGQIVFSLFKKGDS